MARLVGSAKAEKTAFRAASLIYNLSVLEPFGYGHSRRNRQE
jgi:hypothetical protein